MIINTIEELKEWKKEISKMKRKASDPFVKSVYDEMITELSKGDPENERTPSYISIQRFGYDIFSLLHKF